MKTSKNNKLLGLVLIGGFSLFSASNVFAAANDTISNTATINFDVGTVAQTPIGSSPTGNTSGAGTPTDFIEDRVINFTVTQEAGASVAAVPGSLLQYVPYIIQNNGNGAHGFLLSAVHTDGVADPYVITNNDIFTPTSMQTYIDVDDDGAYVPGNDGTVEFVATLAPTATVRVFIVSTIPTIQNDLLTPVANDDLGVVTLLAQASVDGTSGIAADAITNDDNGNISPAGTYSAAGAVAAGTASDIVDDPATMQSVFNDPAGTEDSTGAAGATQNGQMADASSYIITTSALTITKVSKVIYDPINLDASVTVGNPKAIPGAYIQYTITIANAGTSSVSADLTTFADVITAASADVNLDVNLLDDSIALGSTLAFPADSESGGVIAVRIDTIGTARLSAGLTYCLQAIADGCTYGGDPDGTVNIVFTSIAGMGVEAGPPAYTAGELKPGDIVEIVYNVIVQ